MPSVGLLQVSCVTTACSKSSTKYATTLPQGLPDPEAAAPGYAQQHPAPPQPVEAPHPQNAGDPVAQANEAAAANEPPIELDDLSSAGEFSDDDSGVLDF